MKKFERINTIMRYIQNRGHFTIREISENFNISRSTAIRDIQEIEDMGVPLVTEVGRDGGYFVMKNSLTPHIQFTEDEIKALALAFYASKNQQFPFLKGRQSLTEKLLAMISDTQKDHLIQLSEAIVFESTNPLNTNLLELSDQANPELERLLLAYLEANSVRLLLQNQTNMFLSLYRFYHYHDGWKVQGLDLDKNKLVSIELTDIQEVAIISVSDRYSQAEMNKKLQDLKPTANVILSVNSIAIKQFKKYHPVNFTIRYLDPFQTTAIIQGFVDIDISKNEKDDLVSWILFLGEEIVIKIAPNWLKQQVVERLNVMKKVVETN